MTPFSQYYFTFFLALFLFSCNSESTPGKVEDNTKNPTTIEAKIPKEAPKTHWPLKGTIGGNPITMNLIFTIKYKGQSVDSSYEGYYHYDKYQEPLMLYGRMQEGRLKLNETLNWTDDETGIFLGAFDHQATFTGTWTNPQNGQSLPFDLKQDLGKAISFQSFHFFDTLSLYPKTENSPQASFSDTWLIPKSTPDQSIEHFLTKAIFAQVVGDSLAALHSKPSSISEIRKDNFFAFAQSEAATFEDEESMWTDFEENMDMELIYNDGRWLTLGFSYYEYSGQAHGNFWTDLVVFDLQQKQILQLDDLLNPGYETALVSALEQAARKRFAIPDNEALSSILSVDEMEIPDNFGLTGKGIIFLYNVYEIAPYAAGVQRFFVPFTAVSDLLKEGFEQ